MVDMSYIQCSLDPYKQIQFKDFPLLSLLAVIESAQISNVWSTSTFMCHLIQENASTLSDLLKRLGFSITSMSAKPTCSKHPGTPIVSNNIAIQSIELLFHSVLQDNIWHVTRSILYFSKILCEYLQRSLSSHLEFPTLIRSWTTSVNL